MSPAERLAELGEILAAGTQRLLARQGKRIRAVEVVEDHLDVLGQVEAPCGPNSMETAP